MLNYSEFSNIPSDLVELGRIVSSYGVNGFLKIYPYSEDQSILLNINDCWIVKDRSKSYDNNFDGLNFYRHNIISSRAHGKFIIAKFGVDLSREDANALRGYKICVSRSLFPSTDDDEYYWVDLIGCTVHGYSGETPCCIGVVSNIFENGAHPILVVTSDKNILNNYKNKSKADDVLIPFVKSYIIKVAFEVQSIFTSWQLD